MHVTVRPTNRDPARGLLAAACLLAVACNGDGGGPAGPSPVSPGTTSSVSVTHPADHGTIYIGDQVQFQATVSSSGGATPAATGAVWASDAPAVATVSPAGLVTAVSAGEATTIRAGRGRRARLAAHPCLPGVPRPLGGRPERDEYRRASGVAGTGRGGLRRPAGLRFLDTAGGRLHAGWRGGHRDRDEHFHRAAEL